MAETVVAIHGSVSATRKALIHDIVITNIIEYAPELGWRPPDGHELVDLGDAVVGPGGLYVGGGGGGGGGGGTSGPGGDGGDGARGEVRVWAW